VAIFRDLIGGIEMGRVRLEGCNIKGWSVIATKSTRYWRDSQDNAQDVVARQV
jgi:hypothetical protein